MTAESMMTKTSTPDTKKTRVEAPKNFVFNETGNIMLASTGGVGEEVSNNARRLFEEVSVFFASMTKAVSSATNPNTNKPYSIYNYDALKQVIDGSGFFSHVNEVDVMHETSEIGVSFSTELVSAVLGIALGSGAASFAKALVSSAGKESISMGAENSKDETKVANIIFVCEYLLGMPTISAIVTYADSKKVAAQVKIGRCGSGNAGSMSLALHKDTYMFVPPTFIKNYASDFANIHTDPAYNELTSWLQNLLVKSPVINSLYGIEEKKNMEEGDQLSLGGYELRGEFLPSHDNKISVKFDNEDGDSIKIETGNWTTSTIGVTISGGPDKIPSKIILVDGDGKTIAGTTGSYTVKK